MKNYILITLLCLTTFGIAQNSASPRTVTTYGSVMIESTEKLYKTDITLSLENSYYADNACTTVDELKAKYFAEAKKRGVDTSKFIQDDLAYTSSGYRKGGTMLHFETNDKSEMLKVASINMAQIMPAYVQVKDVVNDEQIKQLVKQAIANAYKNAEILAEASGEKIDKVYAVSSYDLEGDTYWRTPNSSPSYLRLTVIYLLKD